MGGIGELFQLYQQYLLPSVLLGGAICIGIILEIIVLVRIRSIIAKNNWLSGGKVLKSFEGVTFISFLGVGLYLFVNNLSVNPKIEGYLSKSLAIAAILSATIVVSRVCVAYIKSKTDNLNGQFPSTSIFGNLTKVAIFGIGILIILNVLGISITPIITALGVGGLAVALALQDTLSNLFAGISIIASNKLRTGDYIKLQSGEEGFVEDISWRTTTIKETSDTMVVIPNSKLSTAIFKNFNLPVKEVNFPVQCMVGYDNDLEKVERISLEAAKKIVADCSACAPDFTPMVRFHTFSEAGMLFAVHFRATEAIMQGPIRHEFIKELTRRFREEDIDISFALRVASHQKDPKDKDSTEE